MALYRKKCGWWLFLWSMCLMLFACSGGGSGSGSTAGTTDNPNTEDAYFKNITSFSLPSQNGPVNGVINDKTISVTMPYGTDLTSLVATFKTDGSSVNVGSVAQISGTTPNNFTKPLIYTVIAADGSTENYIVTVITAGNSANSITSYSLADTPGIISPGNNIAVQVPYGTDLTSLVATFTTDGKSINVGTTPQISGTTPNNFISQVIYTVSAADGSIATYTVTVTIASSSSKDITAFSLSGTPGIISGNNITVTLPYNTNLTSLIATFTTTGESVSINGKNQVSGQTPNDFSAPVTYKVSAADGSTINYTVATTVALKDAKAITSFSLNGTPGKISGNNIAVALPYGTILTSLIATFTTDGKSVIVGTTPQVSGQTPNNYATPVTYIVVAADGNTSNYTVTVTVASSDAKAITSFSLNGTPGAISGNNITVTLPYNTNLTSLIATFTTTGERVSINGKNQVSGQTSNDFTKPVTYTVSAANDTSTNYIVTVTKSKEPSFIMVGNSGQINKLSGTNYTNLNAPTNSSIHAVAVSDSGVYVAVGDLGTILTSNDRISWTAVASNTSNNLRGVAVQDGGVFVAVGDNGKILRSQDSGKTWASVTSPTTKRLNAVTTTYSGSGGFFAVGESGTVLRSNNGINWSIDQSVTASSLNGIASFASRLIAIGDAGTIITTDGGNAWTLQAKQSSNNLYGVAISNPTSGSGLAIAVGANGYVIRSEGFTTWTKDTNLKTAETLYGISSNGNNFVIVGSAGDIFTSLDNGNSWSNNYNDSSDTVINTVTINSDGQAVAMGNSGLVIKSVTGLTTWLKTNKSEPILNAIAISDDGTHVAVGHGVIMASKDGANWTTVANIGTNMKGVAVHRYSTGTLFIAVGDLGTVMSSKDGYNWNTVRDGQVFVRLNAVAINSSGKIMIVGANGYSLTSNDVNIWTVVQTGLQNNLNAIAVDSTSDTFVAVGDSGTVLVSRGSVEWGQVKSGTAGNLYGVSLGLGGKNILAVGENGVIIRSEDNGKAWNNSFISNTKTKTLKAVTSIGADTFYAIGYDGVVMKILTIADHEDSYDLTIMNGVSMNGIAYH